MTISSTAVVDRRRRSEFVKRSGLENNPILKTRLDRNKQNENFASSAKTSFENKMVVTSKTYLPTDEELTVPEVNLGFPVLQAAAFHLGKYCQHQNNEFMLCRAEEKDPRKCIQEGKAVTACALEFFRTLKKTCLGEFTQYYKCIDKGSGEGAFEPCRQTQAVYDACVLDKLNIERPAFGHFCEVQIHDTKRPKPPAERAIEYTDGPDGLPEDAPLPEARYGGRFQWQS